MTYRVIIEVYADDESGSDDVVESHTLELGDVIHLAEFDYKIKLAAVINETIPQAATT